MQLLANNEVDRDRWDRCIQSSSHGLVYGMSWYLDRLCPQWEALISYDYQWVMPLTSNVRYGIKYLYQPSFTQQLGVFAAADDIVVPWADITGFLERRYRFWEINFHRGMHAILPKSALVTKANNFIIDLKDDYAQLKEKYYPILKKNLRRSSHRRLTYAVEDRFERCVELYATTYGKRIPHVKAWEYEAFIHICQHLEKSHSVICRKAVDERQELMAVILLLCDGRRLYNMMNVTPEAGKVSQGNHFLIDAVISEFAGSGLLLDMEGSDLPGVKKFYESFGAENHPYLRVKYNRLPWPLRLLK